MKKTFFLLILLLLMLKSSAQIVKQPVLNLINNIFGDEVYCRDTYFSMNTSGSKFFYQLQIMSETRIEQKINDTPLVLVFDPKYEKGKKSSLPFPTADYEWGILQFVRNFELDSFSFSNEEMFELAMSILNISRVDILKIATDAFIYPKNNTAFEQLVIEINTLYKSNIAINKNDKNCYNQLVKQIEALNQDVYLTVFNAFLKSKTEETTLETLQIFFYEYFNKKIDEYIKELITPKVNIYFSDIPLAIEFPRKWFVPIDNKGVVSNNENEKSKLAFIANKMILSNLNNIEFTILKDFSFKKSQIGKTGLTIDLNGITIDLSQVKNTPLTIPNNFVFVKNAEIGLPEKWFQKLENNTMSIYGENILFGKEGISSNFGLRLIENLTNNPNLNSSEMQFKLDSIDGFNISFSQFDLTFFDGNIQNTDIKGSLIFPGYKIRELDGTFKPAIISIIMTLDNDGGIEITSIDDTGIYINIKDELTVFDTKNILVKKYFSKKSDINIIKKKPNGNK